MGQKRKLIIDCDFGIDESMALALLGANKDVLEPLGITVVNGRRDVDKAAAFISDMCITFGIGLPVAKGMREPLVREESTEKNIIWESWDMKFPDSGKSKKAEDKCGVFYLKELLNSLPEKEKTTLVTMGPLTNIAVLFKMFPEVKNKIQEILIAGGAALGGDVSPSAEFNVYTDPEAAKIVFHSGIPIMMFGLDVTEKCCLTRKQAMKLGQSPMPSARLCGDMAGFLLENTEDKYRGKISINGAAPVMYLIHPEIFKGEKAILDVDCSEGVSRGRTVCDLRWWMHSPEEMASLVFMDADEARFQEYLISALYEVGEQRKTSL